MPTGKRPSSAMAGLGDQGENTSARCDAHKESSQSWFSRTLIGRTPSLPSTFGKKKHAFFKKFHCRKISVPTFNHSQQEQPLQQQQQQENQEVQTFSLIVTPDHQQPETILTQEPSAVEPARQSRNSSSSRSFNWLRKSSPYHQKKVASEELSERRIRKLAVCSLQTQGTQDEDDKQHRRRRFLSCSGLGATDDNTFDITNACTTTTTTTNSSDNNNEDDLKDRSRQEQSAPFLLLDCGCCGGNSGRFLLNEYPPDGSELKTLEDAVKVIDDLRVKFRCRGQQIIGYRRKLRQQRSEMNHLRAGHRKQLEEISDQLFLFESSLRTKEKKLQETLSVKDQVILKQQRVIKRLLKKNSQNTAGTSCSVDDELTPQTSLEISAPSNLPRRKCDNDVDNQNDSDSAIMIEDTFTEVSLAVPNLRNITNNIMSQQDSNADDNTLEVKVTRSVSDVINKQRQDVTAAECKRQQLQQPEMEQQQKQLAGRKTKEERRISNRQKLLLLKRHSGFLKRPEILETVYSVEEDSEQAQQQHQLQQQQQQQAPKPLEKTTDRKKEELKLSSSGSGEGPLGTSSPRPYLMRTTSVTSNESPCLSRRSSASTSCILTGFRYRIDSDMTDADYSTDDDSTRLFYSETDADHSGGGTCSCSQPCSRRSSYGYTNSMEESPQVCCTCNQCLPQPRISASAPTSRRASYGSHFNVKECSSPSHNGQVKSIVSSTNKGENNQPRTKREEIIFKIESADIEDEAKLFNRVMSNHKAVLKPKDVKFKRINKSKARSLEELRDKLKWEQMVESMSADAVTTVTISTDFGTRSSPNRLTLIRGIMERRPSFDHDSLQETSLA